MHKIERAVPVRILPSIAVPIHGFYQVLQCLYKSHDYVRQLHLVDLLFTDPSPPVLY